MEFLLIFPKAIPTALALSHCPSPAWHLRLVVDLISSDCPRPHLPRLQPHHMPSNRPLLVKMSLALILTAVFFQAKMVTAHRSTSPSVLLDNLGLTCLLKGAPESHSSLHSGTQLRAGSYGVCVQ